jgi:hypothetical protein
VIVRAINLKNLTNFDWLLTAEIQVYEKVKAVTNEQNEVSGSAERSSLVRVAVVWSGR